MADLTPQQKKMKVAASQCADIVRDEIKDGSMKSPFKLIGACMRTHMRKGSKARRKARRSRKGRKSAKRSAKRSKRSRRRSRR